jgi:long-chain fatty acid transport protein
MFGNGGMDTDYPGVASQTCPIGGIGTFCGGAIGIDLAQVFISASFADGRFSLGIAPIFAVQAFKEFIRIGAATSSEFQEFTI